MVKNIIIKRFFSVVLVLITVALFSASSQNYNPTFGYKKNMTLEQRKDEVIGIFYRLPDWLDKYEFLIKISKELLPFPENKKNEDNQLMTCISRVWIICEEQDGKLNFTGDADMVMDQALLALLMGVCSGCTAEEIVNDDFSFIDTIGIKEDLAPSRIKDLNAMIAKVKLFAKEQYNWELSK